MCRFTLLLENAISKNYILGWDLGDPLSKSLILGMESPPREKEVSSLGLICYVLWKESADWKAVLLIRRVDSATNCICQLGTGQGMDRVYIWEREGVLTGT